MKKRTKSSSDNPLPAAENQNLIHYKNLTETEKLLWKRSKNY
jgi:hypothetical protein